jgi:hypothetical protein
VIRRRHLGPAAVAAAAAALLLAGCAGGGGGGGADEQGDVPPPPDASLPVAVGAGPADSAALAVAALGSPGAVDAEGIGGTLEGYDGFGAPHDAFAQQVDDEQASGAEGSATTAPPIPDSAVDGDPLVAIPGAAGSIPAGGATPGPAAPADPAAGLPIQSPVALEADFDISGEPVVAREGDAIPPDTQQFVVETIGAREVTLELSGGLLPDGTDTVTLSEGESLTLYNATAKRSYKIELVDVRAV